MPIKPIFYRTPILSVLFFATLSGAATVEVVRGPNDQLHLPNFEVLNPKPEIEEDFTSVKENSTDLPKLKTEIEITYQKDDPEGEDYTLISDNKILKRDLRGRYKIRAEIKSTISQIALLSVSPLGTVEEETLDIFFPEYDSYLEEIKQRIAQNPSLIASFRTITRLDMGASISRLSYQERNRADISQVFSALRIKGEREFNFKQFLTGFDVSSSLVKFSSTGGASAQYLNASLYSGKIRKIGNTQWSYRLLGGAYASTTYATSTNFGYTGIIGPRGIAGLEYSGPKNSRFDIEARASTLLSQLKAYSLSNRGLGLEARYFFATRSTTQFGIGIDYSLLSLKTESKGVVDYGFLSATGWVRF